MRLQRLWEDLNQLTGQVQELVSKQEATCNSLDSSGTYVRSLSGQRETWGGAGKVLEKHGTIIDRLVQGHILDELHHSHDDLQKRTRVASCRRFQLKLLLASIELPILSSSS